MSKVFLFGIDGMAPDLVYKWIDELPNIKKIKESGVYAHLETTKPPISIVAWTSMLSGYDPGQTGIYNYVDRFYKDKISIDLVDSRNIKTDMIWDVLGKKNKKIIAQGIISANPVKPVNGIILSGILTPSFDEKALYPYSLKDELLNICGGKYMFDIAESFAYRKFSLDELIERVNKMMKGQINILKHLLQTKEWDFFAYTGMGSDRLHHRLWSFIDSMHINYKNDPKYSNAIKDYYKYLDKELGEIQSILPKDTVIIICSDHGMNRLDGRVNLNDWLVDNKYLVFNNNYIERAYKEGPIKFSAKDIDWSKTRVFATSAYEALVFINRDLVKNNNDYICLCEELISGIKGIVKKDKNKMNTQIFKTDKIYSCYDKNTPDLIVYFDNLFWGTNSDIGNDGLYSFSNLVGADDALHGREGIFIMSGNKVVAKGDIEKIDILDVAPTILDLFGLEKEKHMHGKVVDYK